MTRTAPAAPDAPAVRGRAARSGRTPLPAATGPGRRAGRGRGAGRDAGQVAVEFAGMLPLILVVLVVLWQLVLVGYTFTLAAHAADRGARAGAAGEDGGPGACAAAARKDLPGSWSAQVSCGTSGDLYTAHVALRVPVLFPGALDLPWTVTGDGGAVWEQEATR